MRVRAVVLAASLLVAGSCAASWSLAASASGNAKAGTLVGNRPDATKASPVAVALSWVATPGATGYTVARTGGVGSIGGTCTGTVTATTCTDQPVVPLTTYTYTVTPIAGAWVGTTSPPRSITA